MSSNRLRLSSQENLLISSPRKTRLDFSNVMASPEPDVNDSKNNSTYRSTAYGGPSPSPSIKSQRDSINTPLGTMLGTTDRDQPDSPLTPVHDSSSRDQPSSPIDPNAGLDASGLDAVATTTSALHAPETNDAQADGDMVFDDSESNSSSNGSDDGRNSNHR